MPDVANHAPVTPTATTSTPPATPDVTQRIRLQDGTQAPAGAAAPRRTNPNRATAKRRKKRRFQLNQKEKITLIALGSITLVLIIAAIIMISSMFATPKDDGLILKGVVAAGVNLGGLTPEEAMVALDEATADTYTKLDMTVSVLDATVKLSPKDTGAKLDIAAVIQDAYNYGRTGSRAEREQARKNALAKSVNIPITSHLNLNTDYIRSEISKLGPQFTSTLTQPTLTLTGEKPSMDVKKPNTDKVHQTLSIYVGTAEYGLDVNKLFDQVLEYYNINIFQVEGVCTVTAPDPIDEQLAAYYEELCIAPVDAQIDPVTFEVTPEIYGYGFDLDAVKEQLAKTPYGTTVEIQLRYLTPNLTEDLLSENLFKDVIGDCSSALGIDSAWNNNAAAACEKLDGLILKSGDTFSFNSLLGTLSGDNGYQEALTFVGKKPTKVMGGGVTHTASALYQCVLEAELEVLEHHSHTYAPSFTEIGKDAYVNKGTADFRFRNSRSEPVRIRASVVDNRIQISIEGTDNRSYEVRIETVVKDTIKPSKLYNTMLPNNPGGYKNGQELVAPITGYEIEVYRHLYNKKTGASEKQVFWKICNYECRDSVLVRLKESSSTTPTTPTTPSSPNGSTGAASTSPTNSSSSGDSANTPGNP